MRKIKSNSIFYVKQQKKSNRQWARKCTATGGGRRTAHPHFNGWAQICCSSKKKEQILLGSIKQSCSPDSYFMLAAKDSITAWWPSQMCRMFSAAEDKELAVGAFSCCRYGQIHWPHTVISQYLMLPAFGQTKCIKNGIGLLNVVAPSEQCVMVSEATHILDTGSHEHFSVSAANPTTVDHHCRHLQWIPLSPLPWRTPGSSWASSV